MGRTEPGVRRTALEGEHVIDEPYIPVCDACGTPLMIHGDSFAGQVCDVTLGLSQLAHDALKSLGVDYVEWRKRENQIIDEEDRSQR